MQALPIIDAHIWIKHNDQIVDPYLEYYNIVTLVNGTTKKRVYKEADPLVQKVILKKFMNAVYDGVTEYEKEMIHSFLKETFKTPRNNSCFQNALAYQLNYGGELVFGSMGFERKDGSIFWEFGGENYTLKQFLKK